MQSIGRYVFVILLLFSFSGYGNNREYHGNHIFLSDGNVFISEVKSNLQILVKDSSLSFGKRLSYAAQTIIDPSIVYDPSYFKIDYPNGDIPMDKGVCTDVVVRAYRLLNVDLQQLIHEDMKSHFDLYPSRKMWGLKGPDKNIDHRRVLNLQVFFSRFGQKLVYSSNPEDYLPGDVVVWKLPNGLLHIGVVIEKKSRKGNPLVVHNIGRGQISEDVLFEWDIIGQYRFYKV